MTLRRSLFLTACLPFRPLLPHTAPFHTTASWKSETPANHYDTLGLDPSSSAGSIKKQFYILSKTHHPDHNPTDPHASERFIKISEAYATLGNPQKRARYDRDVIQQRSTSDNTRQQGSYARSSTPFGSRPASGLSRRRTQFRGPPPSFYRSGGWSQRSNGRGGQSQADSATPPGYEGMNESSRGGGGFGPGQAQAGLDNDVPHFDREGHHRTQEQQDQRRRRRMEKESVEYTEGGSVLVKFFLISVVVTFAFSIPTILDTGREKRQKVREG